jgi:chromosome segregation ATPase
MDADTDSGGGRWMTYAELAEARGIDKSSAARLTFRRHWRRQKDHRGTVRVFVPLDWQDASRDASRDVSDDASRDVSRDLSRVIKPLEDAIGLLREQLERAEGRADRAEATAAELRGRLDDLTAKLTAAQDQAEAAEELRRALEAAQAVVERVGQGREAAEAKVDELTVQATELIAQLDQARAEAQAAAQATDALQAAEAARRARGVLARLRAAWRGE